MTAAKKRINNALVDLLLERRYDKFDVGDIVKRAGVARSTFYLHFRGKDDALLESMWPLIQILVKPPQDNGEIAFLVDHIWENRRLARVVFRDPVQGKLVERMSLEVANALRLDGDTHSNIEVRAFLIAGAQLALLGGWAKGDVSATQEDIVSCLASCWRF